MGALSRAGRGARHTRRVLAGIGAALALCAPALAQEAAKPAESGPRARIAVLPFTVYSAHDQASLGEELASDLRARLETFGTLRVLDATSSAAAATRLAPGDESALRDIARSLGVDFVVSGTLTELAGRYNLDVRVTAAEPGQPGLTQVRTAASPEELSTRIPRIAEAVVEHAVGSAPAMVTKVQVVGAAGFEAMRALMASASMRRLPRTITSAITSPCPTAGARNDGSASTMSKRTSMPCSTRFVATSAETTAGFARRLARSARMRPAS